MRLIGQLAQAAGSAGMIAGQFLDTRCSMPDARSENRESRIENLVSSIEAIHTNKTAKMFRCAAAMGAICGVANESEFDCLCEYGLKIGLGFQIADDILDVCASSEHFGKTVGKDLKQAKATYPVVLGMEKSKQLGKKLADEAVAALAPFGPKADTLRQLAMALLERTK